MHPNRAAWFFAAGLAWLVLRGILAPAYPLLGPGAAVEHGGLAVLLPLVSILASLTIPLFFFSFLVHHDFGGRASLKATTILALAASLLSFVLVVASFLDAFRGSGSDGMLSGTGGSWLLVAGPLVFVASLGFYLAVFARHGGAGPQLRRAATVGAVGTVIPLAMIVLWIIHTRVPGALPWVPSFSQGIAAKALGIVAAGALLWFLESFATTYGRDAVNVA